MAETIIKMASSRETKLLVGSQQGQTVLENGVNLLPCKISFDGAANVEGYFSSIVAKDDVNLTASFRGRTLRGKTVDLSSGDCVGNY